MFDRINKKASFLTLLMIVLFSNVMVIQSNGQTNSMENAIQLFRKGNFIEAEPVFKTLLDARPDHFMLNYYYAACRTENGFFSDLEFICLLNASLGETPAKIDYYFGVHYQLNKIWDLALKHYNKFKLHSSQTDQIELNLAGKIQQCYNRENPVTTKTISTPKQNEVSEEPEPNELISDKKIETLPPEILVEPADSSEKFVINNEPTEVIFEEKNALEESLSVNEIGEKLEIPDETITAKEDTATEIIPDKRAIWAGVPIEFRINNDVTYNNTDNFRTVEGKELFNKGNWKQKELDFTLTKIIELRKEYNTTTDVNEKNSVGEKILEFESGSFKLMEEIAPLLQQAGTLENEYWQNARPGEFEKFISELEKHTEEEVGAKSIPENKNPGLVYLIDPNILLADIEPNKTASDKPETDNLLYKIQIGAFSRNIPSYIQRQFNKLSLIRKIDNYTDENGVVVYTTGNLTTLEDALKMQKQVRQEGIEDAIIVPFYNGKRITLENAKRIEGLI